MAPETSYVYLVRHAHAGGRRSDSRDIYRPLSETGHTRADALDELFKPIDVDRILSSPATRCQQTLGPLSQRTELEIVECKELWEGSSTIEAEAHLAKLDTKHTVVCSHGDIIPALIEQLGNAEVPIKGRGCELGSIWVLERNTRRHEWVHARYVSPKSATL